MPNRKPNRKNSTPSSTYIIVILVVIILILLAYLYLSRSNNNVSSSVSTSTSTAVPNSPNSSNSKRGYRLHNHNGVSQGGTLPPTTLVPGSTTTSIPIPPQSQWNYSQNDVITLQYPTTTSDFLNGQPIVGLSSISPVNFILIDSSVGQIASGTLTVTNGKFDTPIEFTPHSSTGVLQIYHPSPANGSEQDIININIKF